MTEKTITIESIMNFEVGQRVKMNPEFSGVVYLKTLDRLLAREGTVTKVPSYGYFMDNKNVATKWTGDVYVRWDDKISAGAVKMNYKNLKII